MVVPAFQVHHDVVIAFVNPGSQFLRVLALFHSPTLTLSSLDSKSFAISASDGRPPAVTSDASVNVQYVSFAFFGAGMVVEAEAAQAVTD